MTKSIDFRGKSSGSKSRRIPGMDEDDGDYATLRELPLPPIKRTNNNDNDTVSEEGKVRSAFAYSYNSSSINIMEFDVAR